jgi:hypothetical protein
MSHAATSMGVVLLLALAPVVPHLRLAPFATALLVTTLIVCRDLRASRNTPARPWPNVLVYGLYVVGAGLSTAAGVRLHNGAPHAYFTP